MKFARQYEPAILVYRQTRAPGALLLRLGRVYDDGEYELEGETPVAKDFVFATHIVSKDTRGLMQRFKERLAEHVTESQSSLDALVIDLPALRAMLDAGHDPGLLGELETLLGAPALETILRLPILASRAERRRLAEIYTSDDGPPKKKPRALPEWASYAIGGFVFVIALPVATIALFSPDTFTVIREAGESRLIAIGQREESRDAPAEERALTPDQIAQMERRAALQEEIRSRKQTLFFAANLGTLTEEQTYRRAIPGFAPATDAPREPALASEISAPETPDRQEGDIAKPGAEPAPADQGTETDTAIEEAEGMLQSPEEKHLQIAEVIGLPVDIAQLRLVDTDVYDLPPQGENEAATMGVSAMFDVRRNPASILQAGADDMSDIAVDLDGAIASACTAMTDGIAIALEDGTAGDTAQGTLSTTVSTVSIRLQAGRSDIAGMTLTPEICAEGVYEILPFFEIVEEGSPEDEMDNAEGP